MTTPTGQTGQTGPTLLDALALLSWAAEEVVLDTARDTHLAWVDRVHGLIDRPLGPAAAVAGLGHRSIAAGVYRGIGLGLRAAARACGAGADAGLGPAYGEGPRASFLHSAVNGLIGDRIERERSRLAITMAPRVAGRDVALDADALAAAYPEATGRVVVLLHGLCESDVAWQAGRARRGTTYAEELAERGWTPVVLRANTGLALRANGVALAALLERLVEQWPVPVTRLALVGHSMGGLVIRAATAVQAQTGGDAAGWSWPDLVTDVVTLGTPHLGAPLALRARQGGELLARVPEAAGFGRILDQRAAGIDDLIEGLGEDVAPLPRARYRLVSATLTRSPRHPVGALLGDLLVRQPSAYGRDLRGRDLFPGAEVVHVRGHHFDLLNHPRVARELVRWLS